MTATPKVAITFYCTLEQRDRFIKLTHEEMCDSLNEWIVGTLDNYCADIIEEREAIQEE